MYFEVSFHSTYYLFIQWHLMVDHFTWTTLCLDNDFDIFLLHRGKLDDILLFLHKTMSPTCVRSQQIVFHRAMYVVQWNRQNKFPRTISCRVSESNSRVLGREKKCESNVNSLMSSEYFKHDIKCIIIDGPLIIIIEQFLKLCYYSFFR